MNKKEYSHLWYLKNKERIEKNLKQLYYDQPWLKPFHCMRSRCSNTTHWYYKHGIKNRLNEDMVRFLWFRDNGWVMKKPTLDRIDSLLDYTIDNCRFREMAENVKDHKTPKLKIGKWAKNYDKCILCNTTKYQHHAKGYCNSCYDKFDIHLKPSNLKLKELLQKEIEKTQKRLRELEDRIKKLEG